MTDYTKFDAALLAAIRTKPQDFLTLAMTPRLHSAAIRLGVQNQFGLPVPTDRVFDRRLQALRKRGLIRYNGKVWEATCNPS